MIRETPKATELFAQDPLLSSRIYVLDDEEITVQMIDFHLRSAGFDNVVGFTDSQEAIERLKQETPDLIMTDLYMPNVGGSFLTKLVRTFDHLADVPVMVITSESSKSTHHKLTAAGAEQVITKPFAADRLIDSVRTTLKQRATNIGRPHQGPSDRHASKPAAMPTQAANTWKGLQGKLKSLYGRILPGDGMGQTNV